MSDINFIINKDKNERKRKKNEENGSSPIEWTKPADLKAGEDRSEKNNENLDNGKNPNGKNNLNDKDSLKISRQAVLKEIGDTDMAKSQSSESGIGVNLGGSVASLKDKISNIFERKPKKIKEELADYHEAVKKEKDERINGAEVNLPLKKPVREKKDDNSNMNSFFSQNKWQVPNVLKTNLIKGEIVSFFDWKKKLEMLLTLIIIACFFIGLVYGGLIFWQLKSQENTELIAGEISEKKMKVTMLENDVQKIDIFQKKLNLLSSLIDKHIYWTNFFIWLEDGVLSDVYFDGNFSGDTTGSYSFKAHTTSYENIANQIKIWRLNKSIQNIEINSGSLTVPKEEKGSASTALSSLAGGSLTNINFGAAFTVDPNIFYKASSTTSNY